MAALTSSRNTPEMSDFGRMQTYPVEANTTVYLGSMVALNANGNAVPAASVAGLRLVGRAERSAGRRGRRDLGDMFARGLPLRGQRRIDRAAPGWDAVLRG
jgi:hypothetical protein